MHEEKAPAGEGWTDLGAALELEADVVAPLVEASTAWVGRLWGDTPVRRIADLGSGAGAATIALARAFGRAEVIAVDHSAEALARVRDRAWDVGVADRLTTVRADLDGPLGPTGRLELVWISRVLEDLRDPGRLLAEVHDRLVPDGLLAVSEVAQPMRFLPDDVGLGRPGLEERCAGAVGAIRPGTPDWAPALTAAGFVDVCARAFAVSLDPPVRPVVRHLAQLALARGRHLAADRLDADDTAALDRLLDVNDPGGIMQRGDVRLRTSRQVWVARRPEATPA